MANAKQLAKLKEGVLSWNEWRKVVPTVVIDLSAADLRGANLFPVSLAAFNSLQEWECFDADTGKDSAREIRELLHPRLQHLENKSRFLPSRV